ncbi:MAG: ParB/RepB/Spo0J family partition protein [Eubacteriales bacterium]
MKIYYQGSKKQDGDEMIHQIEVSKIVPNPNQPRKDFADEAILKLANSIRQYGIIQPLTVRQTGDGYELISGERRLRASKELGMETVPCVIMNVSEMKSAEMSIIENLLREDLNIFEQAHAIETLIDTYDLTQEQIAKKLSNSQSFVANKLRLLRLSDEEREKILKNNLTERHARALLRIYDADTRQKVLDRIIDEGLNVTKSEELIEKIITSSKTNDSPSDSYSASTKTFKDVKSFYMAIDRAIDSVKNSGINIKSRRIENDEFTELTILIPKPTQSTEKALAKEAM